jgi:hypothetical protein
MLVGMADKTGDDKTGDDKTGTPVYADPLARWFVTEACRITDTAALIAAAGEQLVAAGLPPIAWPTSR